MMGQTQSSQSSLVTARKSFSGFSLLELTFAILFASTAMTAIGTLTLSMSSNGKRMEKVVSKNLRAMDAASYISENWKKAGGGKMSPAAGVLTSGTDARLVYYSDDAWAPAALPVFSSTGSQYTIDEVCADVTGTYGWEVGMLTAVFGDASDYSSGIMPVGTVDSIVDTGTMCDVTLTISVPNVDGVWNVTSTEAATGSVYLSPVNLKRYSVGSNGYLYESTWRYISGTGVVRVTNPLIKDVTTFTFDTSNDYWASLTIEAEDPAWSDTYGTLATITYDQSLIAF